MHRARWMLVLAGLALMAVAVAVVLSESPPSVLATSSAAGQAVAASASGKLAACQAGERIPRGTTAIRLSLAAFVGPRVSVKVLSQGHLLASGEHGSAWSGQTVTVPLGRVSRAIPGATVCFATTSIRDELLVYGRRTEEAIAAHTSRGGYLSGRAGVEYLGPGHASWLSLAASIARHMGLGRAWSGTWAALFAAISTLSALGLASILLVRESDE